MQSQECTLCCDITARNVCGCSYILARPDNIVIEISSSVSVTVMDVLCQISDLIKVSESSQKEICDQSTSSEHSDLSISCSDPSTSTSTTAATEPHSL